MIAGSLTQFLISWKALDKSDYKAETDYKAEQWADHRGLVDQTPNVMRRDVNVT